MKWLINPFERIAGWQALFIGVAAMALTAVVGKINNVAFAGPLYIYAGGAKFSFSAAFAMQAVNYLMLFLTMWLAGVLFSKIKPRVIDIAGTMALALAPMLLFTILCFLPITPSSPFDVPRIIILVLIFVPFAIWIVALMYNAYSVSCNLKGVRATVSFIGALAVTQIALQLISFFMLSGLFTNVPIKAMFKSGSTETVVCIESLTIRQKTENVLKAFEQGDFDEITIYFDETMKKGLPPSGLRIAWTQVNMTAGKFERADMDNLREIKTENHDIIDVPFFFEQGNLNLRLAFNKNGTIGGLFLQTGN